MHEKKEVIWYIALESASGLRCGVKRCGGECGPGRGKVRLPRGVKASEAMKVSNKREGWSEAWRKSEAGEALRSNLSPGDSRVNALCH
jgi:hypothetical protein